LLGNFRDLEIVREGGEEEAGGGRLGRRGRRGKREERRSLKEEEAEGRGRPEYVALGRKKGGLEGLEGGLQEGKPYRSISNVINLGGGKQVIGPSVNEADWRHPRIAQSNLPQSEKINSGFCLRKVGGKLENVKRRSFKKIARVKLEKITFAHTPHGNLR
jgi:hypothetical protein